MSFFQLRTLPGYAWPPLSDGSISQVWVAYLELQRTQWLARQELEARQLEQARTLLAHCITNVPYYRATLPAAGIVPGAIRTLDDFRRIPILTRRVYQERTSEFVATQLPAGTTATQVTQTSGSTGSPTRVHTTNMTQLWWHAFWLRDLEWANIDPTGTLAAIRSIRTLPGDDSVLHGVSLPYWSASLEPLIQTGPSHGMSIGQDPRVQLQWLRKIAPDYLLSVPGNLEALALLAQREGPIPSLRAIQSIASRLTPEAQSLIEGVFGVPVKNLYSCYEAGYLASPCPAGHGLHVHAENVILEVLDADGRPCQPGETGTIFITTLLNLRGPFVRYELGDEATVGGAACPCGRGLPLLSNLLGKVYPMFYLSDGRRKHCSPLVNALRGLGGHWQHQVVQKSRDHVVLRLAVDATWNEELAAKMTQALREFFEGPIRIDLETHERLSSPASGKFMSMINEIE